MLFVIPVAHAAWWIWTKVTSLSPARVLVRFSAALVPATRSGRTLGHVVDPFVGVARWSYLNLANGLDTRWVGYRRSCTFNPIIFWLVLVSRFRTGTENLNFAPSNQSPSLFHVNVQLEKQQPAERFNFNLRWVCPAIPLAPLNNFAHILLTLLTLQRLTSHPSS